MIHAGQAISGVREVLSGAGDDVILAGWGEDIDDQAALVISRGAMGYVGRDDIGVSIGEMPCFVTDRHDERSFENRARLLVWVMMNGNHGARLDLDEIEHEL